MNSAGPIAGIEGMQNGMLRSPLRRMMRGVSLYEPADDRREAMPLGLVTSAFLALLLFVPKVNVLTFRDTYVGVKPEDLFVVLCWLPTVAVVVWRNRAFPDGRPVRVLLGAVTAYVVYIWLSIWFNNSSLAYVVRYSLYVAPVLMLPWLRLRYSSVDRHISNLISGALIFYLVLVIAQRQVVVGGFLLGAYVDDVSHRPMAIFSHPTELGIVSIVLLTLSLFSDGRSSSLKYIDSGIVVALNAFAANRTSLAALTAVYLLFFVRSWRLPTEVARRRLLVVCSIALLIEAFALAPVIVERFAEQVGDPSTTARVAKWETVWTSSVSTPWTVILGSGVGRFGPAVDGFYVRLFGESGAIGALLQGFIFWQLVSLFRRVPGFHKLAYVLLGMLIHSISLDAWYFSRAAYFVWLIFALYVSSFAGQLNEDAGCPTRLSSP